MESDPESDSSFFEEDDGQIFFNHNMHGEISKQKILKSSKQYDLKRQPGHIQIKDNCHFGSDEKEKYYSGHVWDNVEVPVVSRATRRLTVSAINDLVDEEQMRRIRDKEDSNVVKQQLHSVHSELMASVAASEDYQQQVIANDVKETENIKMDMMAQLLSSAHKKQTDRETEEERSRRIDLLNSMLQDSATEPGENCEMLKSFADTNKKIAAVHEDLLDAINHLKEDKEFVEEEEDEIYADIKDQCVYELHKKFALINLAAQEMQEQNARVTEMNQYLDEQTQDTLEHKDEVHQELIRLHAGIQLKQEEEEHHVRDETMQHKEDVLAEIHSKTLKKKINQEYAAEKARQIREAEREAMEASRDPIKERARDAWSTIHTQMLRNKFHKKVVHFEEDDSVNDKMPHTERDEKLRKVRMSSRRKSVVMDL